MPQVEKIIRILAHSARKEKRMKKYRLTKITIKTREIISVPAAAANENEIAVCRVCHTPLPALPPAAAEPAAAVDALNVFSQRNLTREK